MADAVCGQLLRLAKQMPNSLLLDATADEDALANGKLVTKRDGPHTVLITESMRHGGVDRIEQQRSTAFHDDGSRAHNTHSAVFAEVKVDEQFRVIRVSRVVGAVAAGRILNANTAGDHVQVNADMHDIKVIFVDEPDDTINPLGIKGPGEIGIVGVAAAIANAIYRATRRCVLCSGRWA
jgi:xanthine dehydrogenase YagR molybdenum-binding subunit